jgi:hypothetical protein
VLRSLERLDQDIKGLSDRLEKTDIKFDAYVKASDRLLGVATTIITTGAVTILSPFVQAFAPATRAMLGGNA